MTTKKYEAGDFVQSICKKCKKKTRHIVVGLVDGVPAKVQCTDCKGNHNYRTESSPSETSRAKSSSRKAENAEWITFSQKWDEAKAIQYSIGSTFKRGDLLNHTHFGFGVVVATPGYKRMRVLFQEGEKLLSCEN